ncbi:hypothetical protein PPL_07939 [Heterostelium album PN500]|uniref:B box-type domain-containing protein n=1 Tax=Heterostelium pallidum (strain ATCC 26659 / Pp 5 / PN500) TaxID=670386 RepID=D3BHD7_HETP5|nr:hypothetical protein PPL_07939 [Heterostelium album PN500]EFA79114.1 hypothetical protein PPL_07939 [Heterostelium album PN500]|eukprot:XP_020431236.1 hypothetical protein PPL_07939 [Heterostelium album PN500]
MECLVCEDGELQSKELVTLIPCGDVMCSNHQLKENKLCFLCDQPVERIQVLKLRSKRQRVEGPDLDSSPTFMSFSFGSSIAETSTMSSISTSAPSNILDRSLLSKKDTIQKRVCPQHDDQLLSYFCLNPGCQIGMCGHCMVDKHNGHEIKRFTDETLDQIREIGQKTKLEREAKQDVLFQLVDLQKSGLHHLNAKKEFFDKYIDQLCNGIKDSMLGYSNKLFKPVTDELQTNYDANKKHTATLSNMCNLTEYEQSTDQCLRNSIFDFIDSISTTKQWNNVAIDHDQFVLELANSRLTWNEVDDMLSTTIKSFQKRVEGPAKKIVKTDHSTKDGELKLTIDSHCELVSVSVVPDYPSKVEITRFSLGTGNEIDSTFKSVGFDIQGKIDVICNNGLISILCHAENQIVQLQWDQKKKPTPKPLVKGKDTLVSKAFNTFMVEGENHYSFSFNFFTNSNTAMKKLCPDSEVADTNSKITEITDNSGTNNLDSDMPTLNSDNSSSITFDSTTTATTERVQTPMSLNDLDKSITGSPMVSKPTRYRSNLVNGMDSGSILDIFSLSETSPLASMIGEINEACFESNQLTNPLADTPTFETATTLTSTESNQVATDTPIEQNTPTSTSVLLNENGYSVQQKLIYPSDDDTVGYNLCGIPYFVECNTSFDDSLSNLYKGTECSSTSPNTESCKYRVCLARFYHENTKYLYLLWNDKFERIKLTPKKERNTSIEQTCTNQFKCETLSTNPIVASLFAEFNQSLPNVTEQSFQKLILPYTYIEELNQLYFLHVDNKNRPVVLSFHLEHLVWLSNPFPFKGSESSSYSLYVNHEDEPEETADETTTTTTAAATAEPTTTTAPKPTQPSPTRSFGSTSSSFISPYPTKSKTMMMASPSPYKSRNQNSPLPSFKSPVYIPISPVSPMKKSTSNKVGGGRLSTALHEIDQNVVASPTAKPKRTIKRSNVYDEITAAPAPKKKTVAKRKQN